MSYPSPLVAPFRWKLGTSNAGHFDGIKAPIVDSSTNPSSRHMRDEREAMQALAMT
jgi:hypothetical protein